MAKIDTVEVLFQHVEKSKKGFDVSDMLKDENREGETALHAAVKRWMLGDSRALFGQRSQST